MDLTSGKSVETLKAYYWVCKVGLQRIAAFSEQLKRLLLTGFCFQKSVKLKKVFWIPDKTNNAKLKIQKNALELNAWKPFK